MTEGCSAGLPHSEIPGSKDACSSPRLIAACHVFHRLQVPRHSPYALITLTSPMYSALIPCLLYTSDAADDTPCVDLGGRRIIKKKKKKTRQEAKSLRTSSDRHMKSQQYIEIIHSNEDTEQRYADH
eukprot:TRINITY_DN1062_c0_g1_i7.p1 TRINITY_DN1062_c0_g1~~TRINITY_DN1062_c0_g1_i7.p1  ORF type:complete len:127 (-),score=9.73 TRINITY_DN1062_c0_g1_i7:1-381(-)